MKKILFCDMDGTIIDLDGLLYPPDKEKVEKLHQDVYKRQALISQMNGFAVTAK